MRVGINGMGRIGRLALRAAMGGMYRPADDPRAGNRLEVVHVNEIAGNAATAAHLLEFDSVHGRWRDSFISDDEHSIRIGGLLQRHPQFHRRWTEHDGDGWDAAEGVCVV